MIFSKDFTAYWHKAWITRLYNFFTSYVLNSPLKKFHKWNMEKHGAVGGVYWWIQARRGGYLFLDLVRLSPCSLIWLLMALLLNGLRVKDLRCYSRLKVSLREASQSNSCFCLEECWNFGKNNGCFSRCSCCWKNAFGHSYSLC